jgi:hypothetical protein
MGAARSIKMVDDTKALLLGFSASNKARISHLLQVVEDYVLEKEIKTQR